VELKIYDKIEQPLFFGLQQQPNKIELVIVDSNGIRKSRGTILSIGPEGLHLHGSIDKNFDLPLDKDGKLPEIASFDEPQLKIIKAGKVKRATSATNPGGPEKCRDTGRAE
jgi:hypothetical protein